MTQEPAVDLPPTPTLEELERDCRVLMAEIRAGAPVRGWETSRLRQSKVRELDKKLDDYNLAKEILA